ncbi:hypothetical protein F3C99_03485 [Vitellibacter sp. q18]|nr:hypothetical protein [Aequorivita lutea]
MKKLFLLLYLLPLVSMAQLDFESNKFKLDFVSLPEVENLLGDRFPNTPSFAKKTSQKLPSFKMNKNNYREPVSMFEAMAKNESYIPSNIQISLDPREYGIYGGNSSYSADGATSVKNIAYKESLGYLRPELLPYTYGGYRQGSRRSAFYVNFGSGCYSEPSQ